MRQGVKSTNEMKALHSQGAKETGCQGVEVAKETRHHEIEDANEMRTPRNRDAMEIARV